MKSKLIVALDVDNYERAVELIRELSDVVEIFKVGSQLFTRVGPKIVDYINSQGKSCFLDLKFHDIPNTVAKSIESAAALNVFMLTVHASGGADMLKAASQNIPAKPLILGVTVLTSVGGSVQSEVRRLALLSMNCGLNGVIASPHEVSLLRQCVGEKLLIITPGVRPSWADAGDQKRVMTPADAVAAGANYLVIGRPIIEATKPVAAVLRVTTEMASKSLA